MSNRAFSRACVLLLVAVLAGCGDPDAAQTLATPTATPAATFTSTPSFTATVTTTASATATATASTTQTPSATPTLSLTATPTRTPSATQTMTSTETLPPTATPTATVSPTATLNSCENPGIICTVAGTGRTVFDGDGKPSTETSLYFPLGVFFDPQGSPLILDWNNLRLRRINPDGRVETIMGNDVEAFPVDGALAKDTSLHHTSDISFDSAGQLYLSGHHIPIVFRVGLDGRVHTIAGSGEVGYAGDGGPALLAKMGIPYGILALDDGSYFSSDAEFHVIRFIDSKGIIQRFAGTAEAGYSGDGGPAVDAQLHEPRRMQRGSDGSLYFCDTSNHLVRRVGLDGIIQTVAGTPTTPGYDGDGAAAVGALLDTPADLSFAPNGDLYIADSGNNVIRRIDANGIISTVVGTGGAEFRGDGRNALFAELRSPLGIAIAPDGALWIADTFNNRVRRVAGLVSLYP